MSTLKGIVAEDEPVLRAKLRSTLETLWPELEICAEAEDGIQAVRALKPRTCRTSPRHRSKIC